MDTPFLFLSPFPLVSFKAIHKKDSYWNWACLQEEAVFVRLDGRVRRMCTAVGFAVE